MSDEQDPISAGFELQRKVIEASRKAVEEGIEFQQEFSETLVEGVETTEDAQSQGVEMTRNALHTYLDAVESTMPGAEKPVSEIRSTVD